MNQHKIRSNIYCLGLTAVYLESRTFEPRADHKTDGSSSGGKQLLYLKPPDDTWLISPSLWVTKTIYHTNITCAEWFPHTRSSLRLPKVLFTQQGFDKNMGFSPNFHVCEFCNRIRLSLPYINKLCVNVALLSIYVTYWIEKTTLCCCAPPKKIKIAACSIFILYLVCSSCLWLYKFL